MKRHIPWAVNRGLWGLIVSSLLLMGSLRANASIEYQFNSTYSGTPPTGTGPWIDAFFIDGAPGSDTVFLTVTNVNFVSGEFVQGQGNGAASGGLFFNLDTNLDVSNLGFTLVSETKDFGTSIMTSENVVPKSGYKADGDGYYNFTFAFSNMTFSVDSSFTYELTLTNGDLTAADFEQLSTPGPGDTEGPFYAAGHIMGIGNGGGGSGWIEPGNGYTTFTVPEPAPTALVATGLAFLVGRTLRLRRS